MRRAVRRRRPAVWIRHWRGVAAGILGLITVVAATYAVLGYLAQSALPTDMDGRPVIVDPISPDVTAKAGAVDVLGAQEGYGATSRGKNRLRVPSTGLDVPMGALNAVGGVIDPPGFASAYFVRNYGAHTQSQEMASRGTVFVVMHSCRGTSRCPGNYLIDIRHATATVSVGADVFLDGLHYRVSGTETDPKTQVASDPSIWDNTPGRLVLFTCLQRADQGPSTDNMVITAELVSDVADPPHGTAAPSEIGAANG